jgi:hypothetical protein
MEGIRTPNRKRIIEALRKSASAKSSRDSANVAEVVDLRDKPYNIIRDIRRIDIFCIF